MMQALIECDSLGQAHIKELTRYRAGANIKPPTVIIRDNILTATATADSLKLRISWLERLAEHYKTTQKTTIEYIEVNRLTRWQLIWVTLGQIAFVVFLVVVGYFSLKYLLNRK